MKEEEPVTGSKEAIYEEDKAKIAYVQLCMLSINNMNRCKKKVYNYQKKEMHEDKFYGDKYCCPEKIEGNY
jgi:hypothetical protein